MIGTSILKFNPKTGPLRYHVYQIPTLTALTEVPLNSIQVSTGPVFDSAVSTDVENNEQKYVSV
jgi:hypothetical protein